MGPAHKSMPIIAANKKHCADLDIMEASCPSLGWDRLRAIQPARQGLSDWRYHREHNFDKASISATSCRASRPRHARPIRSSLICSDRLPRVERPRRHRSRSHGCSPADLGSFPFQAQPNCVAWKRTSALQMSFLRLTDLRDIERALSAGGRSAFHHRQVSVSKGHSEWKHENYTECISTVQERPSRIFHRFGTN